MFVLCPHCQFLVALDPVSGQPPSHCPRCKELLQAAPAPLHSEAAEIVDAALVEETAFKDDERPPLIDVAESPAPVATTVVTEDIAPVTKSVDAQSADSTIASNTATAPRRAARMRRSTPRWLRAALIPLLLVTLMLQSLLADREQLAANAHWRPLIISLCGILRCAVPVWREPTAFTLLDRNVRADPRRPGVLQVTAAFRNDARWRQPWPSLLLTLSDADGRIAGARLFAPTEYLRARPTQNGLESGQSASVSFDVVEPARQSVAFTFDLR